MSDLKTAALGSMGFAIFTTEKALEGFDDSNAYVRPDGGGNNAAWIAGHLARTYDWALEHFAQRGTLGEQYKDHFGGGTEPADSGYPPFSELTAALKERRQAFSDWFSGLPEEKAAGELEEDFRMFGQTCAGMIGAMAAHENYHAGQLSVIRKQLGMDRVMG